MTLKKSLSLAIMLIISLTIVGNVMAEDFSVRNGINFSMTVDEVKETEKGNGVTDENFYLNDMNGDYYCLGIRTSIAGIDGSRLLYQFDPDTKKLIEFCYMLGPFETSKENAKSYFATISESLINKYGDPLHSSFTDGLIFPVVSNTMQGKVYDIDVSYYEWLLDFGDYYILIDAVNSTHVGIFGTSDVYQAEVGYRYVSKDEAEETITNMIEEENEKERVKEEETNRDL